MLVALALLACGNDVSVRHDTSLESTQDRLGLTDAEVAAVLSFLNDCGTTLALLDEDVGLDSDAAAGLVRARDGGDSRCGTADDSPFATLDEVDDVPQVGDQAIRQLVAWVTGGTGGDGSWEGVSLTVEEQRVVLEIANRASETVLDGDVGLAADEAQSIVDGRPFADLDALADAPQIGASALRKLKDYVPRWGG